LQSRNGQVKKQKREALKRLKASKEQTKGEEKNLQINLQGTKNFLPLQSQTKREARSATQRANEKVKSVKSSDPIGEII
jgi:predicted  nucleic acid-binding Zn-ribbon protein